MKSIFRPTWVEISRKAFENNINKISSYLKDGTKILAVVKANAYGHIAEHLSKIALKNGVFSLGVSSIEEGLSLRKKNIKSSILIMGSIYPLHNLAVCIKNNLTPTISSLQGLEELVKFSKKNNRRVPYHLKIDTGMGRVGVSPQTAVNIINETVALKEIFLEGIYTHFAAADSDKEFTFKQMKKFMTVINHGRKLNLKFIAHAANSAALLKYKEFHLDMVRPGISLYGLSPFKNSDKILKLDPVLTWKTRIVFLKRMPAGSTVSYGRTFSAKNSVMIATLPVGYADGYNRLLSNSGEVLIRGQRCTLAGRVTMDMIMVDVTNVKGVSLGDEAVLIGCQGKEHIRAEEIASLTNTISYETTCAISHRVPRVIV